MTDATASPGGGEAMTSVELPADAPEEFSSVNDALSYLSSLDEKRKQSPAESATDATAEPELAQANSDPETDPAEATEEAEPEDTPPIEPPRSWAKAEKERFQSLPRETQEYLHTREQEREREFRTRQNEAAEKQKAIEAKLQEVDQVRQQYESKIKSAMDVLEREQLRDFADIRTMADVERMAQEDPFRKIQWDTHQQKMQVVAWEAQQAEARKSQESQSKWAEHVQKENALASEYIPELADKVKGPQLTQRAADRLSELGFKPQELADLASGKERLSLYDHRIQRLIFSDLKLADIQSAKVAVSAKPVPPVVRPGVSKPSGSDASEREQVLSRKPELTQKEALELLGLQSGRRRRA